jgi:four helix bundle protein
MAQGSLKERETHVEVVQRVGLLEQDKRQTLLLEAETVGKLLRGLIRSLEAD